jgi:hypothetical protein
MKTKVPVQKVVVVGVLCILLFLIVFLFQGKTKFKNQLTDEKRKSEVLLSEKLTLNKAVKNYKIDIEELQGKTVGLNKLITEANHDIQNKNVEINRLKITNSSIKDLKVKNTELEKLKQQLSDELALNKKALEQAKEAYEKLNNQLAAALETNENLENDNSILKQLFSYNYRTEALQGKKEKLTVNAKRTDKLLVYFDLPGDINNQIHFNVVTPNGKELSSKKDLAANIKITENGDGLTASSNQNTGGSAGTKRVEMSYKPTQKMVKGVYQFNLYNEDRFLGSTQLRLK